MTDYFKLFNSPYFSIGSFLFFQQLGRVLNLESYVTQLRILYLTAQLSIVALSFFLVHKIKQKNGKLKAWKDTRKEAKCEFGM